MSDKLVCIETREPGVAELILNRPARKNAITGPLGVALADRLTELERDDEVRVVLLRGAGGAFCSGLDITEFNADPTPDWVPAFRRIWRRVHVGLWTLGKPIVGALERYAINGGAALALASDLLVAGRGAFLQVGEVRLGMAAPYNLAWLSLRHNEATVARVALLGERLDGETLAHLGIAQRAVADDDVLDAARAWCHELAGFPEGALQRIKAGLRARSDVSPDVWFDRFTGVDPVAAAPRPQRI